MDQARPTGRLLDWKPMGIRQVGRPRQRRQEGVMEDLKKPKGKNWKETAKGRRTGRDVPERGENRQRVVVPNDDDDDNNNTNHIKINDTCIAIINVLHLFYFVVADERC